MFYHFNLKSKRSRGRRCHRDACGSNRLSQEQVTHIVHQGGEPHHSEPVTVERTNEVSVYNPFLESSVHEVEVEVLVGI